MFRYLIQSFRRKLARRITRRHPTLVEAFEVPGVGSIRFANWQNPLVEKKVLTADTVGFFRQFLNPGDLAIDIGANIGHTTVQMALATGPAGLVLGFDPNPYVFEILTQNAGLNPALTRIEAHNLAITDEDAEFFYNSSEASFNNGGISALGDGKHGKYALPQKVRGVNLAAFLEKNYPDFFSRLRLVKIDTEGYDKEILKSISGLLARHRPVVITECFGKNTPDEKMEQFDILAALGYSLYYFAEFDRAAEVVPLTQRQDMLKWKHFDLYALPSRPGTAPDPPRSMTEPAAFDYALRRLRRQHFLHYALQAALMAGLLLAAGRRVAGDGTDNPRLATWPALFGLLALLAIVGVLVRFVSGYIRPNPRRPAAENLRLYQGRVFLRNSLLGLAGLPPLAAFALAGGAWNLVFFAVLLVVPCLVTAPSARAYQRWLLG